MVFGGMYIISDFQRFGWLLPHACIQRDSSEICFYNEVGVSVEVEGKKKEQQVYKN
ncbi:hypothetical protein LV84_02293 [Algoriphagus ratkowskyi]|uniref:Uncharacterized protein n=1 Tax=Algoriphagus ratkowskyi TaxID=57028 RepID=A0A2W7R714_9BACT|nr:hypothetical protein LV84_02293 [Algoriphagus ratkowskyi]